MVFLSNVSKQEKTPAQSHLMSQEKLIAGEVHNDKI